MMKQNSKWLLRVVSTTVAVAVFLTMILTGCGNATKQNEDSKETTQKTAEGTAAANQTEPVKLTVAVQTNANVQDYTTNSYTKLIEGKTNVKLDFIYLPAKPDDAKAKISVMIATGSELPDIINTSILVLDEVTASNYASQGVFTKLNDYLYNASLAPNFMKIQEEDPQFFKTCLKLSDGNFYSVPYYVKQSWNEGPYRAWINTEWLEKVGMKMPSTTSELYDTLKAFVEKDPNGNGKKDEVGIVGSTNGWAQNPFVFLMNAFAYANKDKDYLNVKDGKIFASYVQPEWKQGLEFMNKLIKDGLLSPLSFTQDQTQMKSLINVKGGMAGIVTSGSYSAFDLNVLETKMSLMAPIKGPSGVGYSPRNPSVPTNYWYITKSCKNVETAVKVGDFMLSEEASMLSRFGEKGVEWTDDPSIISQYVYSPETSSEAKKIGILDIKWWNNPQNKSWQTNNPLYLNIDKIAFSTIKQGDDLSKVAPDWNPLYNKTYTPAFPKDVIIKIPYTAEEIKKISDKKATIDKYVIDTSLEFIFGNKPLSQWDNYISELNKMGLEEYIASAQVAYDRTK